MRTLLRAPCSFTLCNLIRFPGMRAKLIASLMLGVFAAHAADALPADIDKVSLSRLPQLTRADMKDDYERRVWDMVHGERTTLLIGPGGISMYSPKLAESMHLFNEYVRYKNTVGRQLSETAILVAAREMDQAYEWNSHENTAHMIGVDAKAIEVIKNGKEMGSKEFKALGEKERMVIEWGRTLFREHTVKPEIFQRMVAMFGDKGMYEVTSLMSDYMFAGLLLTAVDQHKMPDAKYDLPKRKIPVARAIAAAAPTRTAYPAGTDAGSLSRLPLLKCDGLTANDLRICQMVVGPNRTTAAQGPPATSLYSLPVAEAMDMMNRYLGRTVAGPRAFQLASVVGSREFDQQYEYTAHDPAALRNGVPQSTVDIVKFNKPIPASLGPTPEDAKDLAIIRAGRQLFQEHKLDSPLWADLVTHFGKQGALEVVASMADYAMVGLMLNAVDQQVPLERPLLMPLRQ